MIKYKYFILSVLFIFIFVEYASGQKGRRTSVNRDSKRALEKPSEQAQSSLPSRRVESARPAEDLSVPNVEIAEQLNLEMRASMLRSIIRHGYDTGRPLDGQEYSPLHGAKTREEVISLVGLGMNLMARDHKGRMPLHTAANAEVARTLLELLEHDLYGVDDVNALRDHNGGTPLHTIVQTLQIPDNLPDDSNGIEFVEKIIQVLMEYGIDIDVQDKNGKTAFHVAILIRNSYAALALKNKGAGFYVEDNNDQIPIMALYPIRSSEDRIFAMLLEGNSY